MADASAPEGQPDRRAGVRPGLQDLPRSGHRRRAEDRRQGGVGAAHRAGPGDARQARDRRLPGQGRRDAAEGRQRRSHRRRKSSARSSTWPTRPARAGRSRPRLRPLRPRRDRRAARRRPRAVAAAPRRDRCRGTAAAADGKKVYEAACIACHGAGIAGAPKFGDKAAWAPRIAQGVATLYTHAIGGFTGKGGMMPPKGGNADAVRRRGQGRGRYMVAAAK